MDYLFLLLFPFVIQFIPPMIFKNKLGSFIVISGGILTPLITIFALGNGKSQISYFLIPAVIFFFIWIFHLKSLHSKKYSRKNGRPDRRFTPNVHAYYTARRALFSLLGIIALYVALYFLNFS